MEPRQLSRHTNDHGLVDKGSIPVRGKIYLHIRHYSTATRLALRTPIQWVLGALSLGLKQQEHEDDHSFPSSVEVKNG
jgi:hypothetical protein